jgi:integrase
MDATTFDPFSNKPDISASSRKLYTFNLTKLNKGKPIKNLTFLSPPAILEGLRELNPNTRRTYLIAIVSSLKDRPEAKYKKLYNRYYEELMKLNGELKSNTTKSATQKENWINQDEVMGKCEELKDILDEIGNRRKITADEYNRLLQLVVLSLYCLQAPRRNKDYIDMMVVKKTPDESDENYLNIADWKWVFNNYKTAKKYEQKILPVPEELKEIIKVYLAHHPNGKELKKKNPIPVPFLVHQDGRPLQTSTDMTRMLNKIFSGKVGSSMLRNIFLTSKYGDAQKELADDVEAMGTSSETAMNNYIKRD